MCQYSICQYSVCQYSVCQYSICQYSKCQYSLCQYSVSILLRVCYNNSLSCWKTKKFQFVITLYYQKWFQHNIFLWFHFFSSLLFNSIHAEKYIKRGRFKYQRVWLKGNIKLSYNFKAWYTTWYEYYEMILLWLNGINGIWFKNRFLFQNQHFFTFYLTLIQF